ncbi:MAG: YfcE family phosphodiesterase [Candidatus Izemoplasma sp.]|nr:YfcE family phosphodiesterase [Candidatus Izemoplasma sp.]
MVKILIFSDAHGDSDAIKRVLEWQQDAEYKISLGDLEIEEDLLLEHDVIYVSGNSRHDPGFTDENSVSIHNHKILITHGHKYKVQKNLKRLMSQCKAEHYSIALYGHTHMASYQEISGITFINPGSISRPRNTLPPTYCVLTIDEHGLTCQYYDAIQNQAITFNE